MILFDHPALAWGALLGLLPPLLHLLERRRAQPRPFAAFDFLLRAQQGGKRSLRLRRLLLMLARMALLAAVPLALARPHRARAEAGAAAATGPHATALVLDGSGSMRYRRNGRSLFEFARQEARRRLAELGADEPATVFLCAPRSEDPPLPTADRAAILDRLSTFRLSAEPADVAVCLERAAQALSLSELPGKRLVVFSDLQQSGWDLGRPAPTVVTGQGSVRPEVEVVDVAGGPLPNLALSDLSISPSEAVGPRGYQFELTVRNSSAEPKANVPLSLEINGQVVTRGFCDLAPFGSQRKTLAATLPAGDLVEGRLFLPPDALPDDDALAFAVPVPRETQALIVDGAPSNLRYQDEAFFVSTALGAASGSVAVRTTDAESLSAQDLEANLDVLLLLNVRSLPRDRVGALRRFVERGGGLFIALGDRIDPDAFNEQLGSLAPARLRLVRTAAPVGEATEGDGATAAAGSVTAQVPARFGKIDFDSPIFAGFGGGSTEGLLDTRIFRYVQVEAPDKSVAVLAAYDDGSPALLMAERKAGRVLLFTSSAAREWTDWPIRSSFVPVIQQAVQLLGHGESRGLPPVALVGSSATLPLGPPTPTGARLPSGAKLAAVRGERGYTVGPLTEVGLVAVSSVDGAGAPSRDRALDFAVAFDPRESDTRRLDQSEIVARYGGVVRAEVPGPGVALGQGSWALWTGLLVAGLLFFSAEAWLAT